jgi:hypothetical protein
LSEQGQQAKRELEILAAWPTGKTKDLAGKQITFNDLDYIICLKKTYRIFRRTYIYEICLAEVEKFVKIKN